MTNAHSGCPTPWKKFFASEQEVEDRLVIIARHPEDPDNLPAPLVHLPLCGAVASRRPDIPLAHDIDRQGHCDCRLCSNSGGNVKKCKRCGVSKPGGDFMVGDRSVTRCEECRAFTKAAWEACMADPECRAKKKASNRKATLKRYFGVTPEWYAEKLASQGGGCAICGETVSVAGRENLPVDHDHSTGALRDILCENCNHGLGHFKDDPERLEAAAAYLRRHRAASPIPEGGH